MDTRYHRIVIAALLAVTSILSWGASAQACDFEAVMTDDCSTGTGFTKGNSDTSTDFGVITSKYNWTRFSAFRDVEQIVLKSCVFAQPVSLNSHTKRRGSKSLDLSSQQLVKLTKSVRKYISVWEKAELSVNGRTIKSGVRFDFGPIDTPFLCEYHSDTHVRLAFNDINVNAAALGTKGLRSDRPLWNGGISVTIATKKVLFGRSILKPSGVVHEFGHVLGFDHEMAHKGWVPCAEALNVERWVRGDRISYGSGLSTNENVTIAERRFKQYKTQIKGVKFPRPFDAQSVMGYAIKSAYFDSASNLPAGGCGMTGSRTHLSNVDKEVLLLFYGTN
ncbi:MAG: hypothetical protein ACPGRD_06325 [Planktomarina sp.]